MSPYNSSQFSFLKLIASPYLAITSGRSQISGCCSINETTRSAEACACWNLAKILASCITGSKKNPMVEIKKYNTSDSIYIFNTRTPPKLNTNAIAIAATNSTDGKYSPANMAALTECLFIFDVKRSKS